MKHLLVGVVLLAASVATLAAEPVSIPRINWLTPACAAGPVAGTTLALPGRPATPLRLVIAPDMLRAPVPSPFARHEGRDQARQKKGRWIGRNWWWFVPMAAVLTGYTVWCASQECWAD